MRGGRAEHARVGGQIVGAVDAQKHLVGDAERQRVRGLKLAGQRGRKAQRLVRDHAGRHRDDGGARAQCRRAA